MRADIETATTTTVERPAQEAAGLSSEEAKRRLEEHGRNEIEEQNGPSPLRQFAKNLVQPLALLLWACPGLALLADESELTIAIAGVIVINAIFSFAEEYKADQAVAALQEMLPVEVHVRRDGEPAEVATEEVVTGDVLLLEPGDRVAADADLLSATDLRVDESALTGESRPVTPDKQVFAGTYVTGGSGEALVTTTGMETRFGGPRRSRRARRLPPGYYGAFVLDLDGHNVEVVNHTREPWPTTPPATSRRPNVSDGRCRGPTGREGPLPRAN